MGAEAVLFFADRLSRERELTADETERLHLAIRGTKGRRWWTADEDRQVAGMIANGRSAPEIAGELGRSAWSVRLRLARLRKQQITGGNEHAAR